MNKRGFFISIEGIDGSGKTTIIKHLVEWCQKNTSFTEIVQTREPGGTPIAEEIRKLIFKDVTPETEALLFAAARIEHVNKLILPALQANKLVVSDRYIDSSYVYQGRHFSIAEIEQINHWAMAKCLPDLTVVLSLPVEVGYARMHQNDREINRLDLQPTKFHQEIADGYAQLQTKFPSRKIVVVDVNCSEQEAANRVIAACQPFLHDK